MVELALGEVVRFEGFQFDRARGNLVRENASGIAEPLTLGSRAAALLGLLLDRQGNLVTKDEIFAAVWPGTTVEEANLTVQISALRRILDRNRADGSCVQTIPGRGYRFVAPVTRIGAETRSDVRTARTSFDGDERSRPRLSIVVLPFTNLSDDREQQYLADAITEDVTTDLSRIPDLIVISHNTAFTYRNKAIDSRQIGRELGVRYLLEGSVRRSAGRVRVNAQLIDAETDAHLWAERFDRDTDDLLALQDEITSRIAIALNRELIDVEAARPAEHPDALDCIFRGRAALLKPQSRDTYAEAISLFEHALALDPGSVGAQSWLASSLGSRLMEGMTDSRAADIARAEGLSRQALAASPRSPLAHHARGQVLRAQDRYKEAIPEYEAAIAFNRNWVSSRSALADCKLHAGPIDEVISLQQQVVRLSPRDPLISNMYGRIGTAYLLQSRTDEAIVWLEKARDANPARFTPHAFLASAYGLKGETERAAAEHAEARRLENNGVARLKARYLVVSKIRTLFEATYLAGLRKAGLPEE